MSSRSYANSRVLQLDKSTHLHVYKRPMTCMHGLLWRSIAESCRRWDCVHRCPLDRMRHMRCYLHIARELKAQKHWILCMCSCPNQGVVGATPLQVDVQHGIALKMLYMSVCTLLCH